MYSRVGWSHSKEFFNGNDARNYFVGFHNKMKAEVDKMTDAETESLSGEIATKIQNEMTYPGQVKITVIRETRSVAYAK